MAFPRNQYTITSLRLLQSPGDGLCPVQDDRPGAPDLRGAAGDFRSDCPGVLGFGVVGGDDHKIGKLSSDCPHDLAFAPIRLTRTAENHDEPSRLRP